MLSSEVVVAGGGIAGLLVASALLPKTSVTLLEQADELPRSKYWLTDAKAALANPHLQECVDRHYDALDFVAYDGLTATISGEYCLWHTDRLIDRLARSIVERGGRILTGHRLYSITETPKEVQVRANQEVLRARLLIDCMGMGSPLVGAKNVATITGYYILHGCEVRTQGSVRPVALDNVVLDRRPSFFEFFPTATGTAHAALILPSRHHRPGRSIRGEMHFILNKSHYARLIDRSGPPGRSYFGIIPVGRLRQPALDRVIFFGEAGQTNPAASATGLSRMLHTYQELANAVQDCLRSDQLRRRDLLAAVPPSMSRMNRMFQESVFEHLLSFDSDDFRSLVCDLRTCPDDVVNDLVFAEFDFGSARTVPLALRALRHPRGMLGRHVLQSIARFLSWRPSA